MAYFTGPVGPYSAHIPCSRVTLTAAFVAWQISFMLGVEARVLKILTSTFVEFRPAVL
jgi:hypothetical protein